MKQDLLEQRAAEAEERRLGLRIGGWLRLWRRRWRRRPHAAVLGEGAAHGSEHAACTIRAKECDMLVG